MATERIAEWVARHGFERIALQFPDALLAKAPGILAEVCGALNDRQVFILGDSSFGGGGVDEVGAQHYGADCIVRFGNAGQERGGQLPVLFLLGEDGSADCAAEAIEVLQRVEGLFGDDAHLLVLSDLASQHLASLLARGLQEKAQKEWRILLARPQLEALAESSSAWHDWRFGDVKVRWWAGLGALSLAAGGRPRALRVCGQEVDGHVLPASTAILYVGPAASALERRLLLRYGASYPVYRLERPKKPERIFSHSLLQKRYRFVELAKAAGTVGLLLVAAGGPTMLGRALARRLELLLARAGRQSYRLAVGQPTQEKLGNFPEIECYVLLSGPEQFMWDVRDFMVPICTPYEMEVALGAREWTGEYITDLEELLLTAPMTEQLGGSREPRSVEVLGAKKLRSFPKAPEPSVKVPPASITPGLHGVPWKYSQEESFQVRPL